jgi:helicase MOV-10
LPSIVKLLRNFRSHPSILKFPNERFYRGELTSEADVTITHSLLRAECLPKKNFPIVFHSITGKDMREAGSPSFFNVDEASLVKNYVQRLKEMKGSKLGEPLSWHDPISLKFSV